MISVANFRQCASDFGRGGGYKDRESVQHAEPVDFAQREQIETWIREAKAGCVEARGRLLQACREYLRKLADQAVMDSLRAKCAPSNLVQETALDAHRDFAQFHGER